MLFFLCISLFFSYANFPSSPLILGFILGPMLESNLRKGLTYADNGFWSFLTRPISCALLIFALASLFYPFIRDAVEKRKNKELSSDAAVDGDD